MERVTAGEYALGLLDEGERREFEQAAASDAELLRELRWWEARLAHLGLALRPVAPSPFAWLRLQRALAPPRAGTRGTQTWAALATAAALLLAFGWYREVRQPAPEPILVQQPAAVYVALLQVPESTMHWTVSVAPDSGDLLVRAGGEAPAAAAQLDAELWLIADGKPVSLGVIPKTGELRRPLTGASARAGGTVAVSLEPKGGSPTGQPTGPVVTSAPLLRAS
jgi:anti-sigma-K factor RskA